MARANGRICLFGGSFNPPHLGHLLASQWALATLPIDRLLWVPSFSHPFGKPLADFDERLSLCRAAVASLGPAGGVRDYERRFGTTYTVDLLRALHATHRGYRFWWLVGSDAYAERHRWKEWETIEQLATVAVIGRAGSSEGAPLALPNISSTDVRRLAEAGAWDEVAELVPARVLRRLRRSQSGGAS